MELIGPGSLVTYANLATAIHTLQINDNSGDNLRIDITASAGQVVAGNFPLGHTWSFTGTSSLINVGLLTLEYFPAAAEGFDTITATVTDLSTNASTTKAINVAVKPPSSFVGIDGPAFGVGTVMGFLNGTVAHGINNAGELVGAYSNSGSTKAVSGFLLSNGILTTLNNPFATFSVTTEPNSIDALHQIVGSYSGQTSTGGIHPLPENHQGGFLYANGNWTAFDAPQGTYLGGINASGQIAGYHTGSNAQDETQAFTYQNGTYQNFGPAGTEAFGNNDAGQVVGAYAAGLGASSVPPPTHGFLYSNGTFSLLDGPSALSTTARDINNAGLIVGYLQNDSGTHGFAYSPTTGDWQLIDVPGATATLVLGVNDSNQIVGSYTDANNLVHGFTSPLPPPLPHAPGNVDEWILFNGKWEESAQPGPHPAGYRVAAVTDFTGDGTSDILWQNVTTGDVDLWKMANAAWAGSVDLGTHPGAGWQIAGAGDFNHDGTNDVFWFNPGTGETDIWELANGHWAASVQPGLHPLGYQVAGIGDFNHDGTSDVLWFNPATRDVDEWNMSNGHWAGSNDIGIYPSAGYQIAGVGDFNNDGTGDVLWYNPATGATDIWLLQNGHWAASVSPGSQSAGLQVAGVGDFNGDGTGDVLWFNPTTHDTQEWIIANGHSSATIDLGAHPGPATIAGVGDFNGSLTSDVLWHQFV